MNSDERERERERERELVFKVERMYMRKRLPLVCLHAPSMLGPL